MQLIAAEMSRSKACLGEVAVAESAVTLSDWTLLSGILRELSHSATRAKLVFHERKVTLEADTDSQVARAAIAARLIRGVCPDFEIVLPDLESPVVQSKTPSEGSVDEVMASVARLGRDPTAEPKLR